MTFDELVALYREPGETGIPDDFADQLVSAYTDTVNTYDNTSAGLTEQLEAANAATAAADAARITAQAHNARLLRTIPASGGNGPTGSGDETNGTNDDDDTPKPVTVESLITYRSI